MALHDEHQVTKNQNFKQALGHALRGIYHSFCRERNLKIQLAFAVLALVMGMIFEIASYEWLVILAVIFFVFISELLNSAIEAVVDLATAGQYHHLAKRAKDAAAGAVLLAAVLALIVGAIIFTPYVMAWLQAGS